MATQIWIYPALIAVLGQNRRPSFAEMRSFVRRARREAAAAGGSDVACRGKVRRLIEAALKAPSPQLMADE
ncbi:hypothetical protein QUC32_27145 (plasmid) [Novosphingobium resinovorum]|jgi:hypothetical protein|uniref:hypothetical protein n=1 Tax=Novosphingobium TaxID=165696 RepID=UPI0012EAA83C|nr:MULTISPECIES: hypothetical protein [Novosphingobium]MBF7015380.1 hypothetical protein [Novosphingobium sp. HR1a]WJM30061.1 hypothetical protein QUC32_27145 [Novosphingobium resinovorum]